MTTKIQKWGNSYGVRFSKTVLDEKTELLNQEFEVVFEKKGIFLKPIKNKKYTLKELIKGMNSKNKHEALDWGSPVGKEILEEW